MLDDLPEPERLENERLLKEIFSTEHRSTIFDLYFTRLTNRHHSVFKTIRILKLADYDVSDLRDKSIDTLGNLFTLLGVAGLLYRRRPVIRTGIQIAAFCGMVRYFGLFYGYEQGLYKQALFNSDQRSQEIRLLVNHFYPQNGYREMIVDAQMRYLGN